VYSVSSVGSIYKIGVDGGATKTECILVAGSGEVVARHVAPGCNPSVIGPEQARLVVTDALCQLIATFDPRAVSAGGHIETTLLCMAGSRSFWQEFGAKLTDFGRVVIADDALPVLELATDGGPGLVLHGGTGSFVAARAPDGAVHYAGGLGWRFGDPGSGYEIGRRAIARALLELQGWAPPSRLAATVRDQTRLADAGAITRHFYHGTEPNRQIAALAPAVLRLAEEGDHTAHQLVLDACAPLLDLAQQVTSRLFPETPFDTIRAGLSGPILTHPTVVAALTPRSPLPLRPIVAAPIDGVRRLLARN